MENTPGTQENTMNYMKKTIYTGISLLAVILMAAGCAGNPDRNGNTATEQESAPEDRRDPLWGFCADSLEVDEAKVRKGDFFAFRHSFCFDLR